MPEMYMILPDFQMPMEIFWFLAQWVPIDSVLYGLAAVVSRNYEHHAWKVYVLFAIVMGLIGRH